MSYIPICFPTPPNSLAKILPERARIPLLPTFLLADFSPIVELLRQGALDPTDATSMRDLTLNPTRHHSNRGAEPFHTTHTLERSRYITAPIRVSAVQQVDMLNAERRCRWETRFAHNIDLMSPILLLREFPRVP